jgi:hypothetical protein
LESTPLLGATYYSVVDITLQNNDYTPSTLIAEITSKTASLLGSSGIGISMTYATTEPKKFDFLGMTGVNLITNDKQKYLGLMREHFHLLAAFLQVIM